MAGVKAGTHTGPNSGLNALSNSKLIPDVNTQYSIPSEWQDQSVGGPTLKYSPGLQLGGLRKPMKLQIKIGTPANIARRAYERYINNTSMNNGMLKSNYIIFSTQKLCSTLSFQLHASYQINQKPANSHQIGISFSYLCWISIVVRLIPKEDFHPEYVEGHCINVASFSLPDDNSIGQERRLPSYK